MTDSNPYEPTVTDQAVAPEYWSTLRDHPLRVLLVSIVLGLASSLAVLAVTVVLASHREFPAFGYYLLGPSTWLWRLSIGMPSVFALGFATWVTWFLYWWFAMVGTKKVPVISRLFWIAAIHIFSVAFYQMIFALP